MATQTQHAPGTFCWVELATTDQDGAKKFYGSLFGWSFADTDMGPGGVYTIFKNADRDCAALYTLEKERQEQGMPPCWSCYVAVENADTAAQKAASLGAKVLMDPFDVMEHGRMAIIQDPQGAIFCVWQAKKNPGVGVLDEPGAMCWTELMTSDPGAAAKFYTGLFPWTTQKMEGPMEYTTFHRPGDAKGAGGMLKTPNEMPNVPPNWTPYFQVTSTQATVEKTNQLGGGVVVPPQTIPSVGTFAVLRDPQGAVFAVLQPAAM